MSDDEKEWYTSQEAAEYLGVSMARLRLLRRTGRVKGITGGGENVRYAMYHINQLMDADTTDQRLKQPKSDDEAA